MFFQLKFKKKSDMCSFWFIELLSVCSGVMLQVQALLVPLFRFIIHKKRQHRFWWNELGYKHQVSWLLTIFSELKKKMGVKLDLLKGKGCVRAWRSDVMQKCIFQLFFLPHSNWFFDSDYFWDIKYWCYLSKYCLNLIGFNKSLVSRGGIYWTINVHWIS